MIQGINCGCGGDWKCKGCRALYKRRYRNVSRQVLVIRAERRGEERLRAFLIERFSYIAAGELNGWAAVEICKMKP